MEIYFEMLITPVFYILARNDINSLTPGKLAAQAAHANNMLAEYIKNCEDLYKKHTYDTWCGDRGFGTTIVLGGNKFEIKDIIEIVYNMQFLICDDVIDPTYPIEDGAERHKVECHTCSWIFIPDRKYIQRTRFEMLFNRLELYR